MLCSIALESSQGERGGRDVELSTLEITSVESHNKFKTAWMRHECKCMWKQQNKT